MATKATRKQQSEDDELEALVGGAATADVPAPPSSVEGPEAPPPEGYEPIGLAPRDGRPVVVTGVVDGARRQAYAHFRRTRRCDRKTIRWVEHEYWARANSGGAALEFEPDGWRPMPNSDPQRPWEPEITKPRELVARAREA